MIRQMLSSIIAVRPVAGLRTRELLGRPQIFGNIFGYEVVGPPGQAKTLFLKCILETFGEKKTFFTVGGNASKLGLIDVLFDMQPYYILVDEIEYLKPEYQATLLSLMETGILTQTMHSKVRHTHLKTMDICHE